MSAKEKPRICKARNLSQGWYCGDPEGSEHRLGVAYGLTPKEAFYRWLWRRAEVTCWERFFDKISWLRREFLSWS